MSDVEGPVHLLCRGHFAINRFVVGNFFAALNMPFCRLMNMSLIFRIRSRSLPLMYVSDILLSYTLTFIEMTNYLISRILEPHQSLFPVFSLSIADSESNVTYVCLLVAYQLFVESKISSYGPFFKPLRSKIEDFQGSNARTGQKFKYVMHC